MLTKYTARLRPTGSATIIALFLFSLVLVACSAEPSRPPRILPMTLSRLLRIIGCRPWHAFCKRVR